MWAIICAASVILFPLIGMLIGSKKLNLSYQAGKMIFQEKKDEDAEKQYDSQYKMIRALLGSQTAYGIAEALLILIKSGMIKGGYQPAFMTTSRICAALAAALIFDHDSAHGRKGRQDPDRAGQPSGEPVRAHEQRDGFADGHHCLRRCISPSLSVIRTVLYYRL